MRAIDAEEKHYVFAITAQTTHPDTRPCNEMVCKLGGVVITLVIDSGTDFNIMCKETWEWLKANNIVVNDMKQQSSNQFNAYGNNVLSVIGTFNTTISVGDKNMQLLFHVVEQPGKPLLGLISSRQLEFIEINVPEMVNAVGKQLVEPLNKIKDVLIKLPIDKTVRPVIQPYRRVPLAIEEAVDQKIDELLAQNIIEPVIGTADWISPLVIVPKDGGKEVRLCVDMR